MINECVVVLVVCSAGFSGVSTGPSRSVPVAELGLGTFL